MNDLVDDMKRKAYDTSADPKTRRRLIGMSILLALSILTTVTVAWGAYFREKENAQTLAQQIALACEQNDFGPDFSQEDEEALCDNAEKVIEEGSPELQEDEIQEREIQEREIQESEIPDSEDQERERQDAESQDAEEQEPETQEPEIQEEEEQEKEVQDSEIDDPDPNDQIQSGTCTFDGVGTFTLTFETTSGPVTTTCTGTGTPPAPADNNPGGNNVRK